MDPRQQLRERQMVGGQYLIVLICVLVNLIDGYDILALAQAAPRLAEEWQLPPERLGLLFSMGLGGMAVGALAVSPLADRNGRRPAILTCLLLMSLGMAGGALSRGFGEMAAARLVTGIGIGGMTSTVGTLALEYASARAREFAPSVVASAFPVGTIIGGSVAILLMGSYGWQGIFWGGALLSAALFPVAWFYLPESLEFLLSRQPRGALEQTNRILARLHLSPIDMLPPLPEGVESGGGSIKEIFSRRHWPTLALLCCAHPLNMFAFYFILNWSPKWIAELTGSAERGISYSMTVSVGGIAGALLAGAVAQFIGVRRLMLVTLLGLAALIALFGVMPDTPVLLAGSGMLLGASLFGSAAACWLTVAYAFPPQLRATGLGLATTAGRIGSIFGPLTAGYLLAMGLTKLAICIMLALPAVLAAALYARARSVE